MTYQGSGSGVQQDHYYTIRIFDEKEMTLSDIFPEGAYYITPISENIKQQVSVQIKNDPDKRY